jgi:hypothetical protein
MPCTKLSPPYAAASTAMPSQRRQTVTGRGTPRAAARVRAPGIQRSTHGATRAPRDSPAVRSRMSAKICPGRS